MPSEHAQSRPSLGGHRSSNSIHSTESPAASPPQHGTGKKQKHVVHGGARMHTRVPSNKSLHKLAKVEGALSHADLKKLTKNTSSTKLKRNRSSVDVPRRPKSSGSGEGAPRRPTSVHFEIGDQEEGEVEDAWEEASSSASPALSRAPSRSGQSSAKPSANNSRPQSPLPQSPLSKSQSQNYTNTHSTNGGGAARSSQTADAKVITERLLNRTPSATTATTKMSLATATSSEHTPESLEKSQSGPSTQNSTPKTPGGEITSRFIGTSSTPSENSPLPQRLPIPDAKDDIKRAQSMGNLTSHEPDEDSESALKPRSRKSSTTHQQHPYNPPQQSRTQQKLWLQRASSNIEPAQLSTGVAINGMGMSGASTATLVGAGYDGRDPRIKQQLERTGLEYLVVRRHQDPVGLALKRLSQLPGAEKYRRIPRKGTNGSSSYGLSQSLRSKTTINGGRSSFEEVEQGVGVGSQGSVDDRGSEDDGVNAVLRSMWERPYDLSTSQD
ncbi:hypothetical protein LSUE1_G008381 [Lachnellula suecica]|uniref:Uncharacterized protein n=1 Tax=Lachnellula suecica TaxID=602035 RepID=A0A8T9C2K7_9HELO|nr:hypothetical protein LSUE1_G008381 [Lachnellula suecica]